MSKTTPSSPETFLLLLTFLFFTLPFHGNCQAITNSEKTILLELKQHWRDPPAISNWAASLDHCTWTGITCTDGSVTKIQLIEMNITETIPPSICDLKNLSHIVLQLNYLSGPFPTGLYNCSKLEYLDLSQNSFVGTIPDDIFGLSPRLQYLDLGANNFTGDIPANIGRLQGLTSLQLYQNLFSSFPPEIGNLTNLEELDFNYNGFVPQGIPSNFTRLKKLRNLWMGETNLIGEIPEDIGNMTALAWLDLSANGLIGAIPNGLFQLKNLTILYLYKNRLSGGIPQSVEALNLKIIDLSNNSLTGNIPDDFGKLTKLTGLALFFNQLSGEVPVSIGRLPELVDFGLFYNNLSGELPPDFGRHSMLQTFQVASNNFTGVLPEGLCTNGVLRGIAAFDNDLSGGLPQSLGRCNSLMAIVVYDNRISGQIPDGIWTLQNLTQLMISDNLFTGELPDKIATNLSLVEISNNRFSGEIPAGVSSWHNLREFKASNNLFSGEIPQELTALPVLTDLLLDGNNFSGNFPSNIASWQSLTFLNLSRNQLSGEIPAAIGRLPVLTYLDLSENEFSGEIPPEIGSLRPTVLNLSSNSLSGRIPGEFENAVFDSSFLNNPGLCASNPSLGLNSCRSTTRKSNKLSPQLIAAISVIAAVILIVLIYALFVLRSYRKRKHESNLAWEFTPFQRLNFPKSTIASGLTENNIVGSGGSGKVYRVPINRSGEHVAVKRIWNSKKLDEKLEKQFLAEVRTLGTVRHKNIVKLLCYLSSDNSKLLVYEYMENSSLDRWVHSKRRSSTATGSVHHVVFDWPKRLQIAIGAARGLCYMHHDCSTPVIHRDVKSSNILLDSDFNAKIADFGLARMLIKDGEPNTVSSVAGSFGYIAPEYAQTTRVNEKIDVYSFGVILLELTTGREAHDGDDEHSSLAEYAWRHIQEDKPIVDAMDNDIKELRYLDEISRVFMLGVMCTSTIPSSRPTMKEVLHILLQCSDGSPYKVNNGRREYDAAPLLKNSKRERTLEDDDSNYTSIV